MLRPVRKYFPPNPKCTKMQKQSGLSARPHCKSRKYQSSALVLDSQGILIVFSNCCNSKVNSPCCMYLQLTHTQKKKLSCFQPFLNRSTYLQQLQGNRNAKFFVATTICSKEGEERRAIFYPLFLCNFNT